MIQHRFIKKTHYDPVRSWATKCGIIDHPVVNQVLWSIGVQHGKAKDIVTSACKLINREAHTHPKAVIMALYEARGYHVKRLRSLSPSLKRSLLNRYKKEQADALELLK